MLIESTNGSLREMAGIILRDFFLDKNMKNVVSKEEFFEKCK